MALLSGVEMQSSVINEDNRIAELFLLNPPNFGVT